MSKKITQRSTFECSYLMHQRAGLILNSHTYHVEVTVSNKNYCNDGIILSFEGLQSVIDSNLPNNTFIYSRLQDSNVHNIAKLLDDCGVPTILFDTEVCAENIVEYIANRIKLDLATWCPGIVIEYVKLKESNSSVATWVNDSE